MKLYLYGLVFMVLAVKSEHVVAFLDGEVLLRCDSKVKRDSCHRIRWIKYAADVKSIILFTAKNLSDPKRVEMRPDGNGSYSLSLTKLKKSDEGVYSCEMWSGWNCIDVRNISLKIKECKILPAIKAAQGASVNLSCPLDQTAATHPGAINVTWGVLKAATTVLVTPKIAEINGSSLSFRSVGEMDSNWYRCFYKQGHAQRCYDIHLQVQGQGTDINSEEKENVEVKATAETQHSSIPVSAAVTVVLLAVAIAVALTGVFLHRRRRSQTAASQAHWHPTGADSEFYTNCETLDCAVYKHISIYHEIPENLTDNSFFPS